jgi:hypothetical protein
VHDKTPMTLRKARCDKPYADKSLSIHLAGPRYLKTKIPTPVLCTAGGRTNRPAHTTTPAVRQRMLITSADAGKRS